MKKLLILLLLLSGFCFADVLKDVGIAKYAVLETQAFDFPIPLREENNENAKRLTHLYKDTVLFADKETDKYYRVELSENNYAWINKKFVEVQAIIPNKKIDNVSKIEFKTNKKNYEINIKTPFKSAFIIQEEGNNLNFTLFDNRFDPISTSVNHLSGKFILPDKLEDELNLKYINDTALFGYDVNETDKGYLINIKKAPKINKRKPLKNIKVVIDAGHGADEFGACAFGLKEKDINLQISKILAKQLKKRGAKVYLTRKKDKKIGLYERTAFAKEKNADILLSIHQNSLPNPKEVDKKHGVGTYYYNNQAKPLAQKIQENLLSATNFQDDKVNYRSFALNRPTGQLSVLIECGYLIYKPEADKLSDKKFQKIIAKAIVKGCEDYLRESF